ncbi:carnitine dehydratase [Ramlibacter sp. G-1-2-2]|uniref:Carnitine dehydratase n=1 Tax=Ramlibacter agri TaxID=2728837 RepID=A0A848H6X1_9BURK|nr:carnitine dehydratase [Ramlibacter agri]
MYPLLQRLRIVECASFIAAPSCCLHLLQMGAEVVRIDPIGGGPDFHRWPRAEAGSGASLYWEGLNKGKLSVAVDFGSPEGRELVAQIICAPGEDAGLFVTNFPAEGFLAHERLRALRPDLVTTRVMGWADGTSAVDYTVNAAVGVPAMTGPADSATPVNHVLPAWDLLTGAYAAFATLAAERFRRQTGQGQELRVPLSDVALASLANMGQLAEVLQEGDRPRMGNELFGAFGRDFGTADGQRLMVVAITRRQWSGLLEVLGLQVAVAGIEAALGVSFAEDEGRRFRHRAVLLPLVEAAIAQRSAAELAAAFDARGVCWGPYRTLVEGIASDPRLVNANPLFAPVAHPSGSTYPTPGAMATLPQQQRGVPPRAPRLGEHTDQVLAERLGLSSAQIGRLHDQGRIAGPSKD